MLSFSTPCKLDKTCVKILKFADDATIVMLGNRTKACMDTFYAVCSNLSFWCNNWKMLVNCGINKTEYMCFSTTEKNLESVPSSFLFGNKLIKRVEETCVLGLHLDSQLKFHKHSQTVYKQLLH